MDIITLDFEGINWHASHWATKTEEEFTKEALANNFYDNFSKAEQKALLKEAYKQIKAAVKGAPANEKIDPVEKAKAEMKVTGPSVQEAGAAVQPGEVVSEKPQVT